MAGATAVSALLQVVFEKLASTAMEEFSLLLNVGEDLGKLRSTLLTIQDVLEDAEKRSTGEKSLSNWLRKLKDAAFDADDVLDDFHTEILRRKAVKQQNYYMLGQVRNFFSSSNPFSFHLKMAHKIKEIKERLDFIAAERTMFHLREGSSASETRRMGDRQTSSFVNLSEIYGRDDDKESVINFLIDTDNDHQLSILPIVGMGGLGKTTLAQIAFNDMRIKRHFELQIWVCVSEDFDVEKITKTILECGSREECNLSKMESLQHSLGEMLSGKLFLLILDDVWNENEENWDKLKNLLQGGMQGSKVIVTTRSERVASIMGTVTSLHLGVLSEDHCWSLFKQRAFGLGRAEETPRLAAIGKEIVNKCGGVPLAAKALGSMMAFKRREGEWLAIRDSEIWELPEDEIGIIPALRLSYDHLPSRLKQCFAYCAVFPKDYEIDKEKLIQLWIAEGFICSSNENLHAEDMGNEYFNNLLWRSFFSDVQKNAYVNKTTFKIHDLIHDLAQHVAGYECSIMDIGTMRRIPQGCRYSSLVCDTTSHKISKKAYKENKLRSFLLLLQDSHTHVDLRCGVREVPQNMFPSLSHLRVLDLSRSSIKALPNTIGMLGHLRFLDLSRTDIEILPSSIINLHNLQRLNLEYCRHLRVLPDGISKMINLKHLNVYDCLSLTCMPPHLGRLPNLVTLSKFIVTEDHGQTIVELQNLNLLRGQLRIDNIDNVKTPMEAKGAKLKEKEGLRSLSLWWKSSGQGVHREVMDEDVFEYLQPHFNLEQLVVVGYRGSEFPYWMRTRELLLSYQHLVSITLNRLKRCERLPPLGLLPSLKFLNIYEMNAIREIGNEFHGNTGTFPSLQELTFWDMPNLERWSTDAPFPSLTYLNVKGCPNLIPQPCLPPSIIVMNISYSNVESLVAGDLLRGQNFSSLKKLDIYECKSSSSSTSSWEGLQYFTSLVELTIQRCDELICLPSTEQISSLRSLVIRDSPNLVSLGGGVNAALQHLEITHCDRLAYFPEWLGEATSLQSLDIGCCPNLTALPDSVQHLTALQKLSIWRCPHLARRCNTGIGEDWHKIAHIPHIEIN